jgi:glycosyltransferase involved in cell wall biosynthesis
MSETSLVDCVIPYYNESGRLLPVIHAAIQSKQIRNVICVDDGSTDMARVRLQSHKLILLRHPHNMGKAAAIRTGLRHVRTPYVLLLDADIENLTPGLLSMAILMVLARHTDLCIFRRERVLPTTRLLRFDILYGGERIIRTDILRRVCKTMMIGYQLESAINRYCRIHHNAACWIDTSIWQYRKDEKIGHIAGFVQTIRAAWQVVSYKGSLEFAAQVCLFRPEQIQLSQ